MVGVSCVYHLAATSMPKEANQNPRRDCEENVLGTLKILDHALEAGVSRLVFASSGGTVYGPTDAVPIHESHANYPINAYGISKLTCEKYMRLYCDRRQDPPLSTISLRIANPYGINQNIEKAQGALTTFVARAVAGLPIYIWGDGSVVRDFIHVRDVARAFQIAGECSASQTEVNIGSGQGVSLNELLKLIEKILGQKIEREYQPSRGIDVPHNFLDIGRARKLLDWQPKVALEEGVVEMIAGFKKKLSSGSLTNGG
jgi:UDP-glucose 4-epimerase